MGERTTGSLTISTSCHGLARRVASSFLPPQKGSDKLGFPPPLVVHAEKIQTACAIARVDLCKYTE